MNKFNRVLSGGLSICLLSSMVISSSASATSRKDLDVRITQSTDSVDFSWTTVGDVYKVYAYRDGKESLIWSGGDLHYKQTGLEADHAYSYKIIAYKNDQLIDEEVVHTSTLKTKEQVSETERYNEKLFNQSTSKVKTNKKPLQLMGTTQDDKLNEEKLNYPMINAQINSTVKNDKIKLQWVNVPDQDGIYDVYRDGKLIEKVNGNEFVDADVKTNTKYKYKIMGSKRIPDSEIQKKKEFLAKNKVTFSQKDEEILFYETKEIGTIVKSSTNIISAQSRSKKAKPTKPTGKKAKLSQEQQDDFEYPNGVGYLFRYTTFIPMDKAPNPACLGIPIGTVCDFDSFHGDNRGFDPFAESFRTRSDTFVTWDDRKKPNDVAFKPDTGITIGYKDGKKVARAKAPKSDIRLAGQDKGDDWISHQVQVQSAIPLLKIADRNVAPDIDAFYYTKVYSDWKGQFYGVHDKAPSHEFYMYEHPGDIGFDIMLSEHTDFNALFPLAKKHEWKYNLVLPPDGAPVPGGSSSGIDESGNFVFSMGNENYVNSKHYTPTWGSLSLDVHLTEGSKNVTVRLEKLDGTVIETKKGLAGGSVASFYVAGLSEDEEYRIVINTANDSGSYAKGYIHQNDWMDAGITTNHEEVYTYNGVELRKGMYKGKRYAWGLARNGEYVRFEVSIDGGKTVADTSSRTGKGSYTSATTAPSSAYRVFRVCIKDGCGKWW
ncbi:hypothetical protein [Baia soyae]|uniref:Fibronectin type III domain protein n=1 Tax=Baia soyae TaxID=1544746 RepID=A0A4R2RTC7_9BACL|nr:hypothetical protein [Baia soyae]TCP66498.1 hypothetical protein EDD57_1223 [Baia soyae]